MENCFNLEVLNELFNCDLNNCLLATESYDIEYKLNFNLDYDLFKTMNGLANNKGGYIIFGIEPQTRRLNGITSNKIEYYKQNIDSENMRGKILSCCQPNLEYKHYVHTLDDKKYIVFYVPESRNKPHVFMNSGERVSIGDIYFRYNDSVKKIQYAELNSIIEEKRLKEQEKWMKFLGKIAKIGLDNALIIDAKNGELISSDNFESGIVIDENVLSKFKLIKEGQFNEISGDPTLKIIGDLSLKTDTGLYELSTDYNSLLHPNKTHPYRYVDILKKMICENTRTKDGKLLSEGKITYERVRFYIENNNLNSGIENVYVSTIYNTKTYSKKVYNQVKSAFQNMTLEDIEKYKRIK